MLFSCQDDKGGGGSGTVLDMHTQQGHKGNKGVRFEDPHWWAHLPALKPIGLTCLLAERNSEVKRMENGGRKQTLPLCRSVLTPPLSPIRMEERKHTRCRFVDRMYGGARHPPFRPLLVRRFGENWQACLCVCLVVLLTCFVVVVVFVCLWCCSASEGEGCVQR